MNDAGPLATRLFSTRSGKQLAFTELGFGTAPLGNLYKAISEDTAQATLEAAWEVGCRVLRHCAALRPRPFRDTPQPFSARRDRKRPTSSRPRSAACFGCRRRRAHRHRQILRYARPAGGLRLFVRRRHAFDRGDSLERLGIDRIDILFCHDLDCPTTARPPPRSTAHRGVHGGRLPGASRLREEGVVDAIGAGLNEWQIAERMARAGDFDLFLLAGRYTLLEQEFA